jgi:tRNA A37 threonylcarbamoyladenosine modification protein TsaB
MDLRIKEGQKSSAVLHAELHDLMKTCSIKPSDIKQVVYVAGPGFYTGLRMAYGIADILKLTGAKLTSLYTFDIPTLLGFKTYTWITKAYRGEVFVFEKSASSKHPKLFSENDFLIKNWEGEVFVHHRNALDELMASKLTNVQSTQDLFQKNLKAICQQVQSASLLKELFYFRPPEEEFKPNP